VQIKREKPNFDPYPTRFCLRHWKPNDAKLEPQKTEGGIEYLTLRDPALLVRFVGYVMRHYHGATGGTVFLRAQPADYASMRPSLFRDTRDDRIELRVNAYYRLIAELQTAFRNERLRTNELGALLQHYGLKTTWLDVVDNLYTAIWFASAYPSINKEGEREAWLYLIGTEAAAGHLRVANLRLKHSSLTLRPHAQHAYSLSRPSRVEWTRQNVCLNAHVLAAIRIPGINEWSLVGKLAEWQFMFPPPVADNTFKLLLEPRVTEILDRITRVYNLRTGELGVVRSWEDYRVCG
jgi:hypothetical protein